MFHNLLKRTGDWGLSIAYLIAVCGAILGTIIAKADPTLYQDYSTGFRLVIIALAGVIYTLLALFYYDAYADVQEGYERRDVTVERFVFVISILAFVTGTTIDLVTRLDQTLTFRTPIYMFANLILIYGLVQRQRHHDKPLFTKK